MDGRVGVQGGAVMFKKSLVVRMRVALKRIRHIEFP